MNDLPIRRYPVDFLSLFDAMETVLYRSVFREANRFYHVANTIDPVKRETTTNLHYKRMFKRFDQARQTNNPALIMAAEYLMLQRDEKHLKVLAQQAGLDQFLKADITGNQKGIDAIGAALAALKYQSRNSALYHLIVDMGTPRRSFDSHNLAKDVVRDATKTQAARLRLDMRGLNQTELERKKSTLLGKRHENMIASDAAYRAIQKDAKKARDNPPQ